MRLSAIIVNKGGERFIKECLDSIYKNTRTDFETIVIDNSSQHTLKETVRDYKRIRLIENEHNMGLARSLNQGIRLTQSEYVLVMNPDTRIIGNSVDSMVEFMEDNGKCGVCGPKQTSPEGRLQYSARTFYTVLIILLRRTPLGRVFPNSSILKKHLMVDYDHNSVFEADWLQGSCLMIRRKALEEVGLFDERFFLYFEDVDLCKRMKDAGWKVTFYGEAEIAHHHRRGSATPFSRLWFHHLMSMLRYYKKHGLRSR